MKSLRGRLVAAGALLVIATIASATWSGTMFARLGGMVDETLRASEDLIAQAATLATGLEREDDALLLALAGRLEEAQRALAEERARVDASFERLAALVELDDEDRAIAARLRVHVNEYRAFGDELVGMASEPGAYEHYHQVVNPALRRAVSDTARLREDGFLAMQAAGLSARDGARRATWTVAGIALGALLLSVLAALYLARTVLNPISDLTESVNALRLGDFERRVPAGRGDELGRLADGFNRMADSLAAFRRTNLGEVLRAKETLEATLRALPDAVVVVGLDGRVEAMNPTARAQLGTAADDRQLRLEDLPLPREVVSGVRAALRKRPRRASADFEPFPLAQGEWRRMLQPAIAPLPEQATGPLGTLLVLHDVTDFHRLDELRADLIGVTSHELKTPLTTLRLNLLLLAEKAENLEPLQREILAAAAHGCEELSAKVEQLLDLSRIESGQLRLSLERLDVHDAVEHAAERWRERFEEEGVRLEVRRSSVPEAVRGDPVRLGIVLSNLLSNALKYTPRGGTVTMSVEAQTEGAASFVRVRVTDTGLGIPADLRERVFEKFFRVDQSKSGDPPVPGVGIGLYLCRQIVEAHGGSIRCEPGPGGRGTAVVVSLAAERSARAEASMS